MAEIRVEPRKHGRGWLWLVLLLIVIAAILYFLYVSGTFGGRATTPGTTTPAAPGTPTSLLIGPPVHVASAAALLISQLSGGIHGTA